VRIGDTPGAVILSLEILVILGKLSSSLCHYQSKTDGKAARKSREVRRPAIKETFRFAWRHCLKFLFRAK